MTKIRQTDNSKNRLQQRSVPIVLFVVYLRSAVKYCYFFAVSRGDYFSVLKCSWNKDHLLLKKEVKLLCITDISVRSCIKLARLFLTYSPNFSCKMLNFIHNSKKRIFLAFGLFAVIMLISSKNEMSHAHRFLQSLPPLCVQHNGINTFLKTAESQDTITDKVTIHSYHVMHGIFLLLFWKKKKTWRCLRLA